DVDGQVALAAAPILHHLFDRYAACAEQTGDVRQHTWSVAHDEPQIEGAEVLTGWLDRESRQVLAAECARGHATVRAHEQVAPDVDDVAHDAHRGRKRACPEPREQTGPGHRSLEVYGVERPLDAAEYAARMDERGIDP